MLQGSYKTIDKRLPQIILFPIRAMSVGTSHCEFKRKMPAKNHKCIINPQND